MKVKKREAAKFSKHKKEAMKPENMTDRQLKVKSKNVQFVNIENYSLWVPGTYIVLKALISMRLSSAIWGIINDCDETYNYWEPTHFLLYNKGFQTWEYSAEYALRSYTYLLIHAVPAYIYSSLFQPNRILVFFFIRCLLALLSSGAELYFYRGICKQFGGNIGRICLAISLFSCGMFTASTAYLPSSFSMYMTMISYGAWFHGKEQLAIFFTAMSVYLAWPFACITGIPIAFDICVIKGHLKLFIKWCIISTVTILIPMVQIDSNYYGKLVIAPLNIVLYNVFTSHGPDLYGKEPFSFYIMNATLNFNITILAALVSLPLYMGAKTFMKQNVQSDKPVWLALCVMYLWIAIFASQPHKEERFLSPIYPIICFAAAVTIDTLQRIFYYIKPSTCNNHYLQETNWISLCFIIVTSVISFGRIVSQYDGFKAPMNTMMELDKMYSDDNFSQHANIILCMGKEWHRFPSTFFVPDLKWDVRFLESDFKGQLPQAFQTSENATKIIPPNMNDMNREEPSRYVELKNCDIILDIDKQEETVLEPRYTNMDEFKVAISMPILDLQRSSRWFRAFYLPTSQRQYNDYVLLIRKMKS